MSREGRGLFVSIFKNLINSLKPRQLKGNLIGKDYYGNHYFEIPSNRGRPSRYFVPKGKDFSKFDEGLPGEWESWLRHRRKIPPSEEELAQNLANMKMRKLNAQKLEEKFETNESKQKSSTTSYNFPQYDEFELFPGKKK